MYKYNSCVTTSTRPKHHIIQMYNCFTPTPLHITLHTPSADLGQHPNPPFPPSLICTICSAQSSSHEINLVHKFYSVWVPLSVLDIDPVYISFWGSLGFGSDRPNFPTKNMRVLPCYGPVPSFMPSVHRQMWNILGVTYLGCTEPIPKSVTCLYQQKCLGWSCQHTTC